MFNTLGTIQAVTKFVAAGGSVLVAIGAILIVWMAHSTGHKSRQRAATAGLGLFIALFGGLIMLVAVLAYAGDDIPQHLYNAIFFGVITVVAGAGVLAVLYWRKRSDKLRHVKTIIAILIAAGAGLIAVYTWVLSHSTTGGGWVKALEATAPFQTYIPMGGVVLSALALVDLGYNLIRDRIRGPKPATARRARKTRTPRRAPAPARMSAWAERLASEAAAVTEEPSGNTMDGIVWGPGGQRPR